MIEHHTKDGEVPPVRFPRRMLQLWSLGRAQRRPDWLARFRLRPDHEQIDLEWGLFQVFHDLGITNLQTAKEWALLQYNRPECFDAFPIMGTRDMCWQLSWYVETLEGRYPEDISAQYAPNFYLNSRYGTDIYSYIFHPHART